MLPKGAWADARSQARRFFQQGFAQLEEGKTDEAIRSFVAANKILPHPDVQFNIARACADAQRYQDAIKWYERYLDQDPPPDDKGEIQELIKTLRALVPVFLIPKRTDSSVEIKKTPPPKFVEADLRKLRQTAKDLKALSPQRAKELSEIANKYAQIAKNKPPVTPTPTPTPTKDPTPPQATVTKKLAPTKISRLSEKARQVEDYEEQEIVTAATGDAATPFNAPAVVWVLTQQDIRHRGYESVAHALQNVAGLHVIDNFVFVDVGVRGVHEGLRGQTRLIKVLIDGQPTSFRVSSGNFLGLEMIPIRAVDRIELLRGPASALYGANAFAGVLQIVTRRGGDIRGGSIASLVGTNTQASGTSAYSTSGDIILGTKSGRVSVFLAGSIARQDRSGLLFPESSPLFETPIASAGDLSRPTSLFGRMTYALDKSTLLGLDGGLQKLDSQAEWVDYAPLTQFNRVSLNNIWVRLSFDTQFAQTLNFNAFAAYTAGTTAKGNRYRPLRTGATSVVESNHIEENVSSDAFNTKAELLWEVTPTIKMRFGGDFEIDVEDISIAETVFTEDVGVYRAGDRAPAGNSQNEKDQIFANSGFYTQVEAEPVKSLSMIGGLRFDYHNRYGAYVNGRLGSVFQVLEGATIKLLYGSSYRAPSPDQLFHEAAYIGDTIGCENFAPCAATPLRPQIAQTGELVFGYSLGDLLKFQATGYLSFIDDLILSFPTQGGLFVTTNAGSYLSKGIETEFSVKIPKQYSGPITATLMANLSMQVTDTDIPESQFNPVEPIRLEYREQSLFPAVTGGFGLDVVAPSINMGMYTEARYVGERRASGSNLVLGEYENGSLPGYFELDANFSTRELYLLPQKETVISLRMTNITGGQAAEGGFRGWDIPKMGRSIFLRVIQEF
jgi:outer membrane receptor for ferrienterochelin and colicins